MAAVRRLPVRGPGLEAEPRECGGEGHQVPPQKAALPVLGPLLLGPVLTSSGLSAQIAPDPVGHWVSEITGALPSREGVYS